MPWKTKDGVALKEGKSWNDGTYQHPYNWASSWSADDKKTFGLTWEDDPDTSFDNRFYWSKDVERKLVDEDAVDADGNKIKDVDGNQVINEGLKTIWIRQTKNTANGMLSPTDWLVTRKSEKGTAIPDATTTFRDSVRTACNTIETKINNCSSLKEFMALFNTPVDGDGNATGNPPMFDFPKES